MGIRRRGSGGVNPKSETNPKSLKSKTQTIRPMLARDFDAVVRLWQSTEGIGLSESDSKRNLSAYRVNETTAGCLERIACTVRRRLPMPLPWMMRTWKIPFAWHAAR